MVEDLRRAIEHAQQIPDEAQRQLAEQIEAWLQEREWDKVIGSPDGQARLTKLVEEGRSEIARGDVEEGGFGE
jgi:hypothetical protein